MTERPNTVSGLHAKRKELAALREKLLNEAADLAQNITHLDAAIRVFDPDAKLKGISDRYADPLKAPRGHLKRFVLSYLRETEKPRSAQEIAVAWITDQGFENTPGNLKAIKSRVSSSIQNASARGLISAEDRAARPIKWCIK